MENDDIQYQKGFNNGYLMSVHHPDLLEKLIHKLIPENEYLKGLFDGKEQHQHEMAEHDLPDISVNKSIDHNKDKQRDITE